MSDNSAARADAQGAARSRFDRLGAVMRTTLCALRPGCSGPAFALDPDAAAEDMAIAFRAWLGPTERAVLALAAAQALGREEAQMLGDHLLTATGSGWPDPHPRSVAAEAAAWADGATRAERVALICASWQRLGVRDRAELREVLE